MIDYNKFSHYERYRYVQGNIVRTLIRGECYKHDKYIAGENNNKTARYYVCVLIGNEQNDFVFFNIFKTNEEAAEHYNEIKKTIVEGKA